MHIKSLFISEILLISTINYMCNDLKNNDLYIQHSLKLYIEMYTKSLFYSEIVLVYYTSLYVQLQLVCWEYPNIEIHLPITSLLYRMCTMLT